MVDVVKSQRGPRRAWIKQVIAPLLGLSLGLHGLLLLAPLPAPKAAEESPETDPAAEETSVDLLSISTLATATPVPDSPPATPSATAPPPPAAPTAPAPYPVDAPPVPLAAAEEVQAEPLSEATDSPTPEEPTQASADSAPTPGFDPNRQAQLVGSAAGVLGRAPGSSNFDLTDQFPGDIWDLYISRWGAAKQQCFFSAIERESYTLRAPAADLRYLSRNVQLVEQQDISRTFAGQVVQPLGAAYCEANLFEVQDNGVPILWVSLVPVSPGGSTTLVVFWQADPRL
jgi:hypothetical protein